MAYQVYHTRGVILGSVAIGESNRFYKIFTEELGLVSASAQSVREEKSKLRYVLQDFSFVHLDLVRGKEVWRITSAGEWRPLLHIKNNSTSLKLFARYCTLLVRLLQGEGREDEVFNDLVGAVSFLEEQPLPLELVLSFETLVAMRVLAHLGYLDATGYDIFLESGVWTKEILEGFEPLRSKVLPLINEALSASHL
ncbi:DNA repair protein RecO [Candidatus Nomurabacteria bacterium CG1_02_43_90]|uniref:DNA repair protein RecO n=1 Tax=Candidatus Nomurabacteria bacterium CG1_02_43_90 TaxID=1805281 RepID=A0A1J4V372_9BACT|nr:MAG: DNA repair protein RecO [Candidatus Nomurabacteria bacterium CG1_02_43_90]